MKYVPRLYNFLGLNLDEAQEFQPVEPGEYELVITFAEKRSGKVDYLFLRFDIVGEELAKGLSTCLFFPGPDDDAKARMSKLNRFKYFAQAFGFNPSDEIDLNSLIGAHGFALLSYKKQSDEDLAKYGPSNEIARFQAPQG